MDEMFDEYIGYDETIDDLDLMDVLAHYGIKRRSGRYPWGSGRNPYQHSGDFLSRVHELKSKNFTMIDEETGKLLTGETAIARAMGMSTTAFRARYANARDEQRTIEAEKARSMREHGATLQEITKALGYKNDSSVRALLEERTNAKRNKARETAEMLKEKLKQYDGDYLEVGKGAELSLGISRTKLEQALTLLVDEGYEVWAGSVNQQTNLSQKTNTLVLCPPGTPKSAPYQYDKIHIIDDTISYDGGDSYKPSWVYPESMDSKRLSIRYGDEGGEAKDGLIELRRGVKDLSLGDANYAQVRILVDGTHYLKGMAVYSDDLPDGVDVRFNTNKKSGTPKEKVLKPIDENIEKDPNNPFGSLIKEHGGQYYYVDSDGKEKLGLINKRADEGDWNEWKDKLPSQFLAKQSPTLVKRQLDVTVANDEAEYDEIMQVNNPTIRRNLLNAYALERDSSADHLQAAALPRQKYHVILPIDGLKDNEVYAPGYKQGEQLALVRFPHAGTFEIPIVKVNNSVKDGQDKIGKVGGDAIGITSKAAAQLSGADFDGDTVLAIPLTGKVKINAMPYLKQLEGFDPKAEYPIPVDANGKPTKKVMSEEFKQKQMGIVSNLITDMTVKGAPPEEVAEVTKHSMVVIDARKHKLDYRQSALDNHIDYYHEKYQGKTQGGASTILSRAKSPLDIDKRVGSPKINPETGDLEWKQVHETYIDKKGKEQTRFTTITKMSSVKDARELSSGTVVEELYADFANKQKDLARQARLELLNTPKMHVDSQAKKTYAAEVASIDEKLRTVQLNAPREKQAQLLTASKVKAIKQENPAIADDKDALKKLRTTTLRDMRAKVGAKRADITLSDREIEAIKAGAISDTKLTKLIPAVGIDKLRPHFTSNGTNNTLSQAKINQIASLRAAGFTLSAIAEKLGVSTSTVSKALK